jgi:Domain of unknown function (DUF4167)
MKRQRGRGRGGKPGGGHHNPHQPNRTLESSGPETKVRGPASHIYERYLQLARDAQSSGDRVMAENYLQHAEHYFRVLRAMQPAGPPQPQANTDRFGNNMDYDDEDAGSDNENGGGNGDGGGEQQAAAAENGDQPEVEFPAGQQGQQEFNRGGGEGGDFRGRRRGRRNRFRPDGEREGGGDGPREGAPRDQNDGAPRDAAPREERPQGERQPRPERAPREGEQGGPEGFSSGPKPAFLGSD